MNFQEITDSFFWFQQPSINLSFWDHLAFYKSVGLVVIGLGLWALRRYTKHPINKKLLAKFSNFAFTVGIFGLSWFGLRYENTPIFAKRMWAGLIAIGALIWLAFILKYWLTSFRREKADYESQVVKEKYMPKKR